MLLPLGITFADHDDGTADIVGLLPRHDILLHMEVVRRLIHKLHLVLVQYGLKILPLLLHLIHPVLTLVDLLEW